MSRLRGFALLVLVIVVTACATDVRPPTPGKPGKQEPTQGVTPQIIPPPGPQVRVKPGRSALPKGDRLVCVRYRNDAGAGKRYKTVELIVEEAKWLPPPPHPHAPKSTIKIDYVDDLETQPPAQEVGVKVFFRESELRERVKAAGGRWSKTEKLWQMPYETAVSLGLEKRIARR